MTTAATPRRENQGVTLTAAQQTSLALLGASGLLPPDAPEASAAEGGNVRFEYSWYPGDRDTVRVTMTRGGVLVALHYRHDPCDGDDGGPGEWKPDAGLLWASLLEVVGRGGERG